MAQSNQSASSPSQQDQEEESRRVSMVRKHLPEEIVYEILLNLPARSIFRFRATCKAWRSLTSDPAFIQAHPRRPAKTIILLNRARYSIYGNYCLDIHTDGGNVQIQVEKARPFLMPAQLANKERSYLKAYCDGFLCVRACVNGERGEKSYFICNLARKEWTLVALPPDFACYSFLALYFHPSTGEYRLLARAEKRLPWQNYVFQVFSVNRGASGSWRQIKDLMYNEDDYLPANKVLFRLLLCGYAFSSSQVIVPGRIYWSYNQCTAFVVFDIEMEKFRTIPPPQKLYGEGNNRLIKLDEGECLGLCRFTKQMEIHIWSLKDGGYGSNEEWIRLHTITIKNLGCSPMEYMFRNARVLMVSNNGDELLLMLDDRTFVLYNLKSNVIIKKMVAEHPLYPIALWIETIPYLSCRLENTHGVEVS